MHRADGYDWVVDWDISSWPEFRFLILSSRAHGPFHRRVGIHAIRNQPELVSFLVPTKGTEASWIS